MITILNITRVLHQRRCESALSSREVAYRIRERLSRDQYRQERDLYPEIVDFGGEA